MKGLLLGFLSRNVRWNGDNRRIVNAYGYRFNNYNRRGMTLASQV